MTKEVEDIIRNKAYIELTGEERGLIGELAQNEEEYANMKWFLVGSTAAFEAEKIQASPQLKQGVMEHLTAAKKKKGFWLNSVGVFLMPANKRFYKKPAFQIGIAAVAIIGLLFFIDPGMDEKSLALNTPVVEKNDQPSEVLPPALALVENVADELDAQAILSDIKQEEAGKVEELSMSSGEEMVELVEKEEQIGFGMDKDIMERYDEVSLEESIEAPVMVVPEIEEELSVVESDDLITETVALNSVSSADQKEGAVNAQQLDNSGNRRGKFKRDGNKNKSVRAESKKKTIEKPNIDASTSGYYADDIVMEDAESLDSEPGSVRGGALFDATERIYPKSLHIKQTKELNFLFHLAK